MEQHRVLKDQISVIFNPFYHDEIVARADHPEVPTLLGQLLLKLSHTFYFEAGFSV